jgi:tetratricopeptide (TPR) repeat protein
MDRTRQACGLSLLWVITLAVCGPQASANDVPVAPPIVEKKPLPEVAGAVEAARALRNAGKDAEALQTLDKALALSRQAKDQAGEALVLINIASIYRYQAGLNVITASQQAPAELIDKSMKLYQQGLTAAHASGSNFNIGYAELYMGVLEAGKNDADRAFKHYESALSTFKEIDNRYYLARTYLMMGATTFHRRQQPEAALKYYEQALPLFRDAKIWNEAQWVIDDMAAAYDALIAEARAQRK